MDKTSSILVLGQSGLVGSALVRRLNDQGYTNITEHEIRFDLTDPEEAWGCIGGCSPDYVFLAAAKVGGIHANSTYPAEFIRNNLLIAANVIHACYRAGVKKLLFLGSSCIYPRHCEQPMKEEYLFTGTLEPTNSAYAMAKLAGIEMVRAYRRQYGCDFISCMPTNLYGPGDNYHPQDSHVLPALIRKAHEAKENMVIWGSGNPRREFLYVDDLADACILLMNEYSGEEALNIGYGSDLSIREVAETVCKVVGFRGCLAFDATKPDGMPRKLLDSSKLQAMGWKPKVSLEEGIRRTYEDFKTNPRLRK